MKSAICYLRATDSDVESYILKVLRLSRKYKLVVVVDSSSDIQIATYWGRFRKNNLNEDWRAYNKQFFGYIGRCFEKLGADVEFIRIDKKDDWVKTLELVEGSLVFVNKIPGYKRDIDRVSSVGSCDIFLLGNRLWNKGLKVSVAVDPLHENGRPAKLDKILLSKAKSIREPDSPHLTVIHSVFSPPSITKHKQVIKDIHREGLETLCQQANLSSKQSVLLEGRPEYSLPKWILREEVDILCLGLVVRSWLSGILVGSTAREIMENPVCDLLLVKAGR